MRTVVFGLGVQGNKRSIIAKGDLVFTVDPVNKNADFSSIKDVNLDEFDTAILCVPDQEKKDLIKTLVKYKKNILVEKPLLLTPAEFNELSNLVKANNTTLYIAYNHRFEPHWENIPKLIKDNSLNHVYQVNLFYGNGTAELVKQSPWRDSELGVISDLASHLLDIIDYWFNLDNFSVEYVKANCFENRTYDHAIIHLNGPIQINLEVSLLSWRNSFKADFFCSEGSIHLDSLCKWGPTSLKLRKRKHPSGFPDEITTTLIQSDPTWQKEYEYFKELIASKNSGNLDGSIKIAEFLLQIKKKLNEK